jgi:hypothetical protein
MAPMRMPASPNALEKVRPTMTFGQRSSSEMKLVPENSA